jgi:tetratricopeptide (TPR) repeat protein
LSIDDVRYQVYVLAGKTYYHLNTGELDRALECLTNAQRTLSDHPEVGDLNQRLEIYGLLSTAYLRLPQFNKAIESANRALELSSSSRPSIYHALSGYTGPAEVYLSLLETDRENSRLAAMACRACHQLGRYSRMFPIGEPPYLLSQGRYYWLKGKQKKAHAEWQRALGAAERRSMLNEQARVHYEIGRHLDLRSAERQRHLEQAHRILTQGDENYYRKAVEEAMLTAHE